MKARRARQTRRVAKGKGKLAAIPAWSAHPLLDLVGTPAEFGRALLGTAEREYARHPHPLYAWCAYLQARRLETTLPDWVLQYLDAVATELLRRAKSPPKDPARAAFEALRFKGRRGSGNAFDLAGQAADWLLVNEADYEDSIGKKGSQVVAERRKISASTVYRARAQRG